jgi:hypothetical protein
MTCGGQGGRECGCVAPDGLMEFLSSFRSGIGAPSGPAGAGPDGDVGGPEPAARRPPRAVALDQADTSPPVLAEPQLPPVPAAGTEAGSPAAGALPSGPRFEAAPAGPIGPGPGPAPGWAHPPTWPPASAAPPGWYPPSGGPAPGGPPFAGWPAPAGPPARKWRKRVGVTAGVLGGLIALMVAVPTFLGARAGGPVPALDSLLSSPPAPGYRIDPASPVNGYLSPSQMTQLDGGYPIPKNLRVYASTWVNDDGSFVRELSVLSPTAPDAEAVGAGAFNAMISAGGRPFDLPGLSGRAQGISLPAGPNRAAESLAVVVRSRLTLLFVSAGPDQSAGGPAMVGRLAQSTASSLAIDRGSVGTKP